MYTKIEKCRVCKNKNLELVVDLGEQYLTGVFPKKEDMARLTKGPLRLVKCHGQGCGLLQLEHTFSPPEMYGENYGYRSGLNRSMVNHLQSKVQKIVGMTQLKKGDLVIDIGSNDGTTLGFYPDDLDLVGIDPTGKKFHKYYAPHVQLIPDFFSAKLVTAKFAGKKAKVITSFSMFYDLEEPVEFAKDIASVLDPQNGVWIFEQSYMPMMLDTNSYDTICHEHLEYYGLKQIKWIVEAAGMKVVDVETNNVNGGSFSVVAALSGSQREANTAVINMFLKDEEDRKLDSLAPYQAFFKRAQESRKELVDFLHAARKEGKTVNGLGASTKGNVVLQFCQLGTSDIPAIGDVNPDKFGAVTPGTSIPIEDEKRILEARPDYLLVLPWHFREFFVKNPAFKGRKLVFPLPKLEVVEV